MLTNLSAKDIERLDSFGEESLQKLRSHKANEKYHGLDLSVILKNF